MTDTGGLWTATVAREVRYVLRVRTSNWRRLMAATSLTTTTAHDEDTSPLPAPRVRPAATSASPSAA